MPRARKTTKPVTNTITGEKRIEPPAKAQPLKVKPVTAPDPRPTGPAIDRRDQITGTDELRARRGRR